MPESEINRILGIKNNRMSFIYARVSSHDQKADLDRLASLAITHRGIDLCGDPFPVSASASWQSMKDEYLKSLKQVRLRLPALRMKPVHNNAQRFENGQIFICQKHRILCIKLWKIY
ncbi:MAG: hypothetical protein M1462_06435 [Candidatus Thermoplasmatota archaeon]|nr:hypothetical protein [Candidatus Thermoplasmatota archaeon]